MKIKLSGRYTKYIPYVVCVFAAAVIIVVISGGSASRAPSDEQAVQAEDHLWSNFAPGTQMQVPSGSVGPDRELLAFQDHLSQQLAAILSQVRGAGTVHVRIMLEFGPSFSYHEGIRSSESQTLERDSEGGAREILEMQDESSLSMLRGSGGAEEPVILRVDSASVRGVLVVAEGAGDSTVRTDLSTAVTTLLDVAAHRVTVLPGKGGK